MASKWMPRKAAQRAFPVLDHCEECGSTETLERHHPDLNKPIEVKILCKPCHVAAHMMTEQGWGRSKKKQKACKICGKLFWPNHSKNSSTCGKDCLSEAGRRNAMKRWHPNSTELCEIEPKDSDGSGTR